MEAFTVLRDVTQKLDRLGFPYFVTGSMVTILFGEPRLTSDIDVVVALPLNGVSAFCRAFLQPEYYLDEQTISQAVTAHTQFNIIHPASGLKIDVIVPPDTPFNRGRFARSSRVPAGNDFDAPFASVEDVIIKKMEYYREGGSEKHLRDITGILKTQTEMVDRPYVQVWAARLGLEEIWQSIVNRM